MPDSSRLESLSHHGDLLSFHSEALADKPCLKRVQFSSEPGCSYGKEEPEGGETVESGGKNFPMWYHQPPLTIEEAGGESEWRNFPMQHHQPPAQQAALTGRATRGEAQAEVETELLVPSIDQALLHQGPLHAEVVS